jgi:hypothetical protein
MTAQELLTDMFLQQASMETGSSLGNWKRRRHEGNMFGQYIFFATEKLYHYSKIP